MKAIFMLVVLSLFDGLSRGFIRKYQYFLTNKYLRGDPPGLGYYAGPASILSNPSAQRVLFGHYSSIEERDNGSSTGSEGSAAGRTLLGLSNIGFPLAQLLDVYKKNLEEVISAAKNVTSSPQTGEYSSQWDQCQGELELCNRIPELNIKCAVQCLGRRHPILSAITDLVSAVPEYLCSVKDTIYDKFFDFQGINFEQFTNFKTYLTGFKESKKGIGDIARAGAFSLLPLIFNRIPTDFLPLREVDKEIATALAAAELQQPPSDPTLSNRLCLSIDYRKVITTLLIQLFKDPSLTDIILGGLSTITVIAKYLPGIFQLPFSVTLEIIRLLTGGICGFLSFSGTGFRPPCDSLGGFPTPGLPLPLFPGLPQDFGCTEKQVFPNAVSADKEMESTSARRKRHVDPQLEAELFRLARATAKKLEGGAEFVKTSETLGSGETPSSQNDGKDPVLRKRRSLAVGSGRKLQK